MIILWTIIAIFMFSAVYFSQNCQICNSRTDEINQFTITKKGSDEIIARIFKDKNDWKAIIDNGYEVKELA